MTFEMLVSDLTSRIFVDSATVAVRKCAGVQLAPAIHSLSRRSAGYRLFYVARAVNFGIKLYNDQHNAQVSNVFIYLLLPYMFRAFF
jgi:hypothetical protein